MVFDQAAVPVPGATVTVTDLLAAAGGAPLTATTASDGSYTVNQIPAGDVVEIAVTKDGYTSRRRVGSFDSQPAAGANVVSFGGTGVLGNGGSDPGQAYFISSYPEVKTVAHAGTTVVFTLSEALDDVNRQRFGAGIRLVPSGTVGATDPNAVIPGTTSGVTLGWDATNTIATMTIPNGTLTAPSYIAVLAASGTDRVSDKDNNPLGQAADGSWTGSLAAGERVRAVFKNVDLALSSTDTTGAKRWAATHQDYASIP